MRKILAIESGGIRGLIPALIATEMEEVTGSRCAKHFDLIVGCGSGTVLATALALGIRAADMVRYYREHGREIYRGSWFTALLRRTALNAIMADSLSWTSLEASLADLFGGHAFSDCEVPTICLNPFDPLDTFDSRTIRKDITATRVAVRCSAIPREGVPTAAGHAFASAKATWQDEKFRIVHLGTGLEPSTMPRLQGKLGWGPPILALMVRASIQATEQTIRDLGADYIGFHPSLGVAPVASDDAREPSLERLILLTSHYLKDAPVRLKIVQIAGKALL